MCSSLQHPLSTHQQAFPVHSMFISFRVHLLLGVFLIPDSLELHRPFHGFSVLDTDPLLGVLLTKPLHPLFGSLHSINCFLLCAKCFNFVRSHCQLLALFPDDESLFEKILVHT